MKRSESDEDQLLKFIESGSGRTGKSVEIPSPEGRSAAGWTALQNLKVQPEILTMLEQLREHKLFKGKWKTGAHVAWSMIYLGLQSCYQFYSKEQEDWKGYRSNFIALNESLREKSNQHKQEQILSTTRNFRTTIHAYLNKDTAFGKFRAWVTLEKAMKARDVVEDVKQYDQLMRSPTAPVLDSNLVFDNRVGTYWEQLYPALQGPLNEDAADALYIELTQDHFDELESARGVQDSE